MSKRIGLWVFASLLIAGVATGAYMYSNGSSDYPKASHCTFTKSSVSSVATTVESNGASSCSTQKQATFTAKPIDTSAYSALSRTNRSLSIKSAAACCGSNNAESTTLQAKESYAVKSTNSDATESTIVAQATK